MTDLSIPRSLDAYPIVTPVTLRFSDQDPMGHINNVAITALLESGRTGLLRAMFEHVELPPKSMVLANLTVDYLREIKYPDTVLVGARLVHVGTKSLRAVYAIFQDDKCCVTSHSTNVFFNATTRKAMAPPAPVREALLQILDEHNG